MDEQTKIPKFRRCVLQNFPFIEQDFDALTDYELLCKVVEYLNKVIDAQNADTQSYTTLENAFNDLKNYVDNYFDNLDVQDEINNKLEEMADNGELQAIIADYISANVAWTFDTVADMKASTTLQSGSYAHTLGFRSINDGGGGFYKIDETGTANEMDIIAIGDLNAHLILQPILTPEMLGAYADNTHDDSDYFARAFQIVDKVSLNNKQYLLEYQLTIPEGKELSGIKDSIGYAKLNTLTGLKLAGRKITVKNIELTGATQQNYGLYCCGNNEGGNTDGANHFSQCIVKNMIISNYNYAIYFAGVVWNNTFDNIRMNQNNYGVYSSSTFYVMTTHFQNIYFSGCKTYDVQMSKTNAVFECCNFGISTNKCIQLTQQSNVRINNSNFECDTNITGTGVLIEVTGKNLTISNCAFKMCCANTITLFSTGAAVQNLELNNNTYESVTIGGVSNALVKIFGDSITGAKYGCINVNRGNNDIPVNIQTADRIPYGKYPYIRLNGYIQAYSSGDISSTANLVIGDLVYFYQTNTIAYYNGTALKTFTTS